MRRVCAWCGTQLDDAGVQTPGDSAISHGICTDCRTALVNGTGMPVQEFLASLDQPVFLLDSDHTVGMVNREALEMFGRPAADVLGERTGTVFECENADLPGGCGNTIHCSGCAIRRAVAHTHETGEPQIEIPATVRMVDNAQPEDVELVISTIRVGNRILLRIDEHRD